MSLLTSKGIVFNSEGNFTAMAGFVFFPGGWNASELNRIETQVGGDYQGDD